MVDPLIALRANVKVCAKGLVVGFTLGALIHEGALGARKRRGFAVAFYEVLAYLGAYKFKQKAQVTYNRVVAQNGTPGLPEVMHAHAHQSKADDQGQPSDTKSNQAEQRQQRAEGAKNHKAVTHGQVGIESLKHGRIPIQDRGWQIHFAS